MKKETKLPAVTETQTADLQPNAAPDGDAVTCSCQAVDAAPAAAEPDAAPMISAESRRRTKRYRRSFTGVVTLNGFGDVLLNGDDLGAAMAAAFGMSLENDPMERRSFAGRLEVELTDMSADWEDRDE